MTIYNFNKYQSCAIQTYNFFYFTDGMFNLNKKVNRMTKVMEDMKKRLVASSAVASAAPQAKTINDSKTDFADELDEGLPLSNIDDFMNFEEKLKDKHFLNETVIFSH